MKDIVILGAGGIAKEVVFLIECINRFVALEERYNILGYVDKNEKTHRNNDLHPVVMDDNGLLEYEKELSVALGIGLPIISSKICTKIMSKSNLFFPNLIAPSAIGDWGRIKKGKGNIICANCVLTTDIEIGDFNILNLLCTVGHDSKIGNFNIFNPSANISGNCEIKNENLFGTGSQILQNLRIGNNVTIGAGAVVTKDIVDPGIYVGIPARRLIKKKLNKME